MRDGGHQQVPQTDRSEQVTIYEIENEQDPMKETRKRLLIIRILEVAAFMIATFIIMKKIESQEVFSAWCSACVALCLIFVLVIDTIMCFIYGLIIGRARHSSVMTTGQMLAAYLFGGNVDYRARLQVCIEMNA
jgi:uncharacterized membrane protein YhdT